ncbi:hypothetical protein Tco_0462324 [Tanacetum coccineum]
MFVFFVNALLQNTMAEQNVPAQPPTRTDEQIVPRSQWLTIGKSNLLFNAQRFKEPIFLIIMDILSNHQLSSISTCDSANVPLLSNLQQFLKNALAITPVNPSHPFELPPSGDTVIDFVNELGYPEPVEIVSSIRTNYVYQPWGNSNPLLKPLLDQERLLQAVIEEFYSGDLRQVSHTKQPPSLSENPKKKVTPLHNLMTDDYVLRKSQSMSLKYLKMVAENTKKTPQGSASMQPATKRATPKKPTTTTPVKQTKPAPPPTKKLSKRKLPQKVRKGKPAFQLVDEEDEAQQESIPQREDDDPDLELAKKLSLETPQEKGEGEGDDADLEQAIKLSLDPAFLPQGRAPVGGVTIRDPVSEATPKLHEVVGKGKALRDQSPPDSTTGPSSRPDDDTSEKVIHESSSTSDSERTESDTETAAPKGDKDQDEVDTSTVTSGVSIPVSDPEKAHI